MKATVHVTLKPGVLDPQGQTIQRASEAIGFTRIADVRQGKFFEVEVAADGDLEAARAELERFAREVLANPVIEDYRIEFPAAASTGS
ncbi:MAG: phosphoribosylformylglycinamidine synthase subunit PurS [Chloracidobacterium sp.]|nr:phosphoribosylformylglycinamidine synthase subunit PurS [Chloracidobacterium sp.]MDW8218153.1 phosphoribosylformylglycinamidine synthase subunit PurS [Acidobacteriota bacterium]